MPQRLLRLRIFDKSSGNQASKKMLFTEIWDLKAVSFALAVAQDDAPVFGASF
jgi:hypothetical protein